MNYDRRTQRSAAATEDKPRPASLPIEIIDWRPLVKNSLRGFVTAKLGKTQILHDLAAMASGGSRWIAMPSKPRLNRDGSPVIGQNGKPIYTPIVSWTDREAADRFSRSVIEALLAIHPDAFGGGSDDR